MTLPYAILLCLHVLAAAFWVGGMSVMSFAVRPAAVQTLEPAPRLAFMASALGRFFSAVTLAIAVLLASGLAMIALTGAFGSGYWRVNSMAGAGLAMIAIFGAIRVGPYRRMRSAVASGDWPVAAASLKVIRRWVEFNLALGCAVFAVAIVARAV